MMFPDIPIKTIIIPSFYNMFPTKIPWLSRRFSQYIPSYSIIIQSFSHTFPHGFPMLFPWFSNSFASGNACPGRNSAATSWAAAASATFRATPRPSWPCPRLGAAAKSGGCRASCCAMAGQLGNGGGFRISDGGALYQASNRGFHGRILVVSRIICSKISRRWRPYGTP